MKLSLIVAAAENRCIGINNNLPWHLPEDLKYFKRVTMGKPIIMGRKTWESIGRPLPGRTNIVITNNPDYSIDGLTKDQLQAMRIVHSLDEAVKIAQAIAEIDGVDEVMVIGGAGIYELCLPKADRIYYTHVKAEVNGDAFFPAIDWNDWKKVDQEDFSASENNPYDYSFTVYNKS